MEWRRREGYGKKERKHVRTKGRIRNREDRGIDRICVVARFERDEKSKNNKKQIKNNL